MSWWWVPIGHLIETQICRHHRKHAAGCIYVYSFVCICDNSGKEALNVGRGVDMRGISRGTFWLSEKDKAILVSITHTTAFTTAVHLKHRCSNKHCSHFFLHFVSIFFLSFLWLGSLFKVISDFPLGCFFPQKMNHPLCLQHLFLGKKSTHYKMCLLVVCTLSAPFSGYLKIITTSWRMFL